ncbi:hypothetical protein D8674_026144 [Pyrus ussuriensis x Pyrus communis]|uniref:Uncharacterized protein n=1 Tax=Pyrus ussuriensis x Pyrus communis TaxID=2448454 RepID=A0A5N5ID30_9ROSA|nr:hypothetical protein D8674_026144 [Pyrus ussuriensis x Pyrus communis]
MASIIICIRVKDPLTVTCEVAAVQTRIAGWSVTVKIQGFWHGFEKMNEVVMVVWGDEGDGGDGAR